MKTASDDADTLTLAHESKNSIDLPDGESVTTSKLDSMEFEFDFELINTAAYRKVFNKARSNLPPEKGSRVHSPPHAPTSSSASAPVTVELPSFNTHAVITKDTTEAAGDGTGGMREEEHDADSENQPESTSKKSEFRIGEHSVGTTIGIGGNGITSGQSVHLTFFKDYYSEDNIYPYDKVACVRAYHPRAPDEFILERGDMLKVDGIWDDGWAVGVKLNERAEDYDREYKVQKDSQALSGEPKAFPVSYSL